MKNTLKKLFAVMVMLALFLPNISVFAELSVGEKKQRFLEQLQSDAALGEYVKDGKIAKFKTEEEILELKKKWAKEDGVEWVDKKDVIVADDVEKQGLVAKADAAGDLPPLSKVEYTNEPLTIDDLLAGEVFVAKSSESMIQEFFERINSPMKDYKKEIILNSADYVENKMTKNLGILSAAKILDSQKYNWEMPDFNTQIGIALLELVNNKMISSDNESLEEIYNKFCNGWISAYGESDFNYPKDSYLNHIVDATYTKLQLFKSGDYNYERLYNVVLQNGEKISFSEGERLKNEEAFAVKRFLAEFASSKAEYERWISFNEGSLYSVYEKWFGWKDLHFDMSKNVYHGERILIPFKIKKDQQLLFQRFEFSENEEILDSVKKIFPEIPTTVIDAIDIKDWEMFDIRFYEAREYISRNKNIILGRGENDNLMLIVALLEKEKYMLFGKTDPLTREEWGNVFLESLFKDQTSSEETYYTKENAPDYLKNDINKKTKIFIEKLNLEVKKDNNNSSFFLPVSSGYALSAVESTSLEKSIRDGLDNTWEKEVPSLYFKPTQNEAFTSYNEGARKLKWIIIHSNDKSYRTSPFINLVENFSKKSRGESESSIHFIVSGHERKAIYETLKDAYGNMIASKNVHWIYRDIIDKNGSKLVTLPGDTVQIIPVKDMAYHARPENFESIGIEHEGAADAGSKNSEFTKEEYSSSAALVRHLSKKYSIPRIYYGKGENNWQDVHVPGIKSHAQVSGCSTKGGGSGGSCHTDPDGSAALGFPAESSWDWPYYMSLIGPRHLQVELRQKNGDGQWYSLENKDNEYNKGEKINGDEVKIEKVWKKGEKKEFELKVTNIGRTVTPKNGTEEKYEGAITLKSTGSANLNHKTPENIATFMGEKGETTLKKGESVVYQIDIKPESADFKSVQLDLSYKAEEDVPYYFRAYFTGTTATVSEENKESHWAESIAKGLVGKGNVGEGDVKGNMDEDIPRWKMLQLAYLVRGIVPEKNLLSSGFKDVFPGSIPSYDYIADAYKRGWIKGEECTDIKTLRCFYPKKELNRAEASKILLEIFQKNTVSFLPIKTFSDVKQGEWYYNYIMWMANTKSNGKPIVTKNEKSIINGYADGTFLPSNYLKQGEALSLLCNLSGCKTAKISNQISLSAVDPKPVEEITLGVPYEQIFDESNATAPTTFPSLSDELKILQGNTEQKDRITETEGKKTITLKTPTERIHVMAEKKDQDGDEMFYFWNATGGEFSAVDQKNFSEIFWQPYALEKILNENRKEALNCIDAEDTALTPTLSQREREHIMTCTYDLNTTRGDGRGYIGEGGIQIIVNYELRQTNAEGGNYTEGDTTPLLMPTPTLWSKTEGGNWMDKTTWQKCDTEGKNCTAANTLPTSSDNVMLRGRMILNFPSNLSVQYLKNATIASGAELISMGPVALQISENIKNEGTIDADANTLSFTIYGNLENRGIWNTQGQLTMYGSRNVKFLTPSPVFAKITIQGGMNFLNSPTFSGASVNTDYYMSIPENGYMKIIAPLCRTGAITAWNTETKSIDPKKNATVICQNQEEKTAQTIGNITAPNIVLKGGKKELLANNNMIVLSGKTTITEETTLENKYGQYSPLSFQGSVVNKGKIQNYNNATGNGALYTHLYGNMWNEGTWNGYALYLYGDLNTPKILYGMEKVAPQQNIIFQTDYSVEHDLVLPVNTNFSSRKLRLPETGTLTLKGKTCYFDGILEKERKNTVICDGGTDSTPQILGNITAPNIVLQNGTKEISQYETKFYGNTAVAETAKVQTKLGQQGRPWYLYGDFINAGKIEKNTNQEKIQIMLYGNVKNTGTWDTYYTYIYPNQNGTAKKMEGTENMMSVGHITFSNLITFETTNLSFGANLNFNGQTMTFPENMTITQKGSSCFFNGIKSKESGKNLTIVCDGGTQEKPQQLGAITADTIFFRNGIKEIPYETRLIGKSTVEETATIQNVPIQNATLVAEGFLQNKGTIKTLQKGEKTGSGTTEKLETGSGNISIKSYGDLENAETGKWNISYLYLYKNKDGTPKTIKGSSTMNQSQYAYFLESLEMTNTGISFPGRLLFNGQKIKFLGTYKETENAVSGMVMKGEYCDYSGTVEDGQSIDIFCEGGTQEKPQKMGSFTKGTNVFLKNGIKEGGYFYGNATIEETATLQNPKGQEGRTEFRGDKLTNKGTIQNNPLSPANNYSIYFYGKEIENTGIWKNYQTVLYERTDKMPVEMKGTENIQSYYFSSSTPLKYTFEPIFTNTSLNLQNKIVEIPFGKSARIQSPYCVFNGILTGGRTIKCDREEPQKLGTILAGTTDNIILSGGKKEAYTNNSFYADTTILAETLLENTANATVEIFGNLNNAGEIRQKGTNSLYIRVRGNINTPGEVSIPASYGAIQFAPKIVSGVSYYDFELHNAENIVEPLNGKSSTLVQKGGLYTSSTVAMPKNDLNISWTLRSRPQVPNGQTAKPWDIFSLTREAMTDPSAIPLSDQLKTTTENIFKITNATGTTLKENLQTSTTIQTEKKTLTLSTGVKAEIKGITGNARLRENAELLLKTETNLQNFSVSLEKGSVIKFTTLTGSGTIEGEGTIHITEGATVGTLNAPNAEIVLKTGKPYKGSITAKKITFE